MIGRVPASNRADARNEAHPTCRENEDEYGRKEPKCPIDQVTAKKSFQKVVETLDEPLEKILCSVGNLLHFARGGLNKDDQSESGDPGADH